MPRKLTFHSVPVQFVKQLLCRTGLLGLALFVMPPFAAAPTFAQLATVYIVIIVWCYYDGELTRRRWPMALFEACIWLLFAIKWSQVLLLAFGADSGAFPLRL